MVHCRYSVRIFLLDAPGSSPWAPILDRPVSRIRPTIYLNPAISPSPATHAIPAKTAAWAAPSMRPSPSSARPIRPAWTWPGSPAAWRPSAPRPSGAGGGTRWPEPRRTCLRPIGGPAPGLSGPGPDLCPDPVSDPESGPPGGSVARRCARTGPRRSA